MELIINVPVAAVRAVLARIDAARARMGTWAFVETPRVSGKMAKRLRNERCQCPLVALAEAEGHAGDWESKDGRAAVAPAAYALGIDTSVGWAIAGAADMYESPYRADLLAALGVSA